MTHQQSEQINELAAALAKAQGLLQPVLKDKTAKIPTKTGGGYSYSYADLSSLWEAIRHALSDNGIAVVQMPSTEGGRVNLTTMLAHASGQYISSTYSSSAGDGNPQSIGSAITYLRRYALAAMVGAVSDDDDDGAAASRPAQPQQQRRAAEYVPAPEQAPQKPEQTPEQARAAFFKRYSRLIGGDTWEQARAVRVFADTDEPATLDEWRTAWKLAAAAERDALVQHPADLL